MPIRILPLIAVLLIAVGTEVHHTAAAEPQRPNILWISCEDMSPHLGCYGDPNAQTPAIDRLATEGVRYTRTFTVAGVCAPCRSSIITGMFPSSLGSQHMRCRATLPDEVKCFPEYLRKAGYYCTNNSKTDYNFSVPAGAWDESSGKAHWRKRPEGKPFFAVFNLGTTHESKIHGGRKPAGEEPRPEGNRAAEKHALPPYYPDTPVVRADWDKYYEQIAAMDGQVARVLADLAEDGLQNETIVFFWSDHGVGLPRAKRWLYDSGTHVPLIVRVPEKLRQTQQGQPGSVDGQLVSFIDLAPTVLNLAGIEIPSNMQGRAFLGSDLSPPREYIYGARDRMDERYDIIRSVRDRRYRYVRNYEPFKAYYQYMNTPEKGGTMQELRRLHALGQLTPTAKLFMADTKPLEELYDVENDPHEVNNLADSPEHRKVLARLRKAHVAWVLRTKDLGLVPEPEIVSRSQASGSGYAILRRPESEGLIERLQEVAAAGQHGNAARPMLLRALEDPDSAVRYWAAIGLGNLGGEAKSAADALSAALEDDSAVVRIAAARALCRMELPKKALPVLAEELNSDRQWVRLHAAVALDEMGEQARPCIAALKEALNDRENKYVVRVANHALNALEGTHRTVR